MITELDLVVLTRDLPQQGLQEGDLGTVVLVHQNGLAYEVEFVTLGGETIAVVMLPQRQYAPPRLARSPTRAGSHSSHRAV